MNTQVLAILRFSAAIIVVLFHQVPRFGFLDQLPHFLLAGPQMCTFFFVLSGVGLAAAYKEKTIITSEFLFKRVFRIYPLYLASLIVPVTALLLAAKLDYQNLVINLALMQSWIPPYPLTINEPAWFLSALISCYLTFPLVFKWLTSFKSKTLCFCLSLLFWFATQITLVLLLNSASYKGYPSVLHDLIYYFPLSHYCSFLIGITGGMLLVDTEKNRYFQFSYKIFFAVLLLLVFLLQYQSSIDGFLNFKLAYGASFYAPFFFLLICTIFFLQELELSDRCKRLISLAGSLSFPVYILQKPVSILFFLFFTSNGILDLIIYLIVLFFSSLVINILVEEPIQRYSKKMLQKNSAGRISDTASPKPAG